MNQTLDTRIRQIMSGQTRGPLAAVARLLLACVEPIYTAIVGARNHLFDRQLVHVAKLPRPVISVGNLTTGGTGKTPVVQWIVRELQSMGHRPCVLMRGYKRADERSSSDEEQMLRDSLGVPVFADPKRYLAGQRALQRHPDIDVFVLDDGFQHRRLARDLDVVLIDATNPFGYDHVLPRGMLRESLKGFARGDVTILTRTDLAPPGRVEHIEAAVRARNPAMPLLRSVHQLDQVMGDGTRGSIDRLHGKRVWAFCGLGNPEAFENALRKAGVELAGVTRFGDHHPYESADLEMLVTKAAAHHSDVLLTTEKDFVKLRELPAMLSASVPVLYIGVRIVMDDASTQAMRSILKTCMTPPPASGAAL